MKRREVTICFETFTFPDDADRVDAALVDGEVRHAFCGGREIRIIDLKSLVASYVELAFGRCPAAIRSAVTGGRIGWLSFYAMRDPSCVWIARYRIAVAGPANCREALTRIYELWCVAGLNVADLRFECVAYDHEIVEDVAMREIPLATTSDPNEGFHKKSTSYGIDLDPTQRLFVNSPNENIRLLAPAGSGKTTTLLFRCRALLERNPDARILLLTFTRVAAEEIRCRMHQYAEFASLRGHVDVSTLNAYGYRIVRGLYPKTRLGEMSTTWKTFAMGNYCREILLSSCAYGRLALDDKWIRKNSRTFIEFFDTLKTLAFDHSALWDERTLSDRVQKLRVYGEGPSSLFISAVDLLREKGLIDSRILNEQLQEVANKIMPLYTEVTDEMFAKGALTFEDQKYWSLRELCSDGTAMGSVRYAHIMVDEFQDVNPIDVEMVKALREKNDAGLTIVGDDDQTIFEWRGATPNYILNPGKYFSTQRHPLEFGTCQLSVNYRSPKNIVDHARLLIEHNKDRVQKKTEARQQDEAQIVHADGSSYFAVLKLILADVKRSGYKSVAVITRKRSHLIPYQVMLSRLGHGYYAARDINVMLSDAFTDVIKLLEAHDKLSKAKWKFNADDAILLLNSIRTYKLGREKAETLRKLMCPHKYKTMMEFAKGLCTGDYEALFENRGFGYGDRMQGFMRTEDISATLRYMGENFNGLKKSFERAEDDIFFADPPIDELAAFGCEYKKAYAKFCKDLRLAQKNLKAIEESVGSSAEKAVQKASSEKLHLMTGLRTKGKEYDVVYILHSEADVWPNKLACKEGFTEGERRLFYVVMTRAKKKLCFVYDNDPSEYLSEAGIGYLPDASTAKAPRSPRKDVATKKTKRARVKLGPTGKKRKVRK